MSTDAASRIDQGSLEAIFDGPPGQSLTPIVQCVQVKPLTGSTAPSERFRVVFSDIKNFVQTMLATQANHHVHDGKLRKGCFVRLKAYNASFVKGKKWVAMQTHRRCQKY
jgi:replication factor A1